jgi:uncharacterized DUF497 family protein
MAPGFRIVGFEWDADNIRHLWMRHKVEPQEAEEVFIGQCKIRRGRFVDGTPYYEALGSTCSGRFLLVAFQLKKGGKVRVATARPMSPREKRWYAKH